MNAAYLLRPKDQVRYLYDDCSFRQSLEKMYRYGYAAIPVISRDGRYVGTVSEGDLLWRLVDGKALRTSLTRDLEELPIRDILRRDRYPSVRITASMGTLLEAAMDQNFIPLVDDEDHFIGIVTRRDILRSLTGGAPPDRDP